jgi:hypothetical protein
MKVSKLFMSHSPLPLKNATKLQKKSAKTIKQLSQIKTKMERSQQEVARTKPAPTAS